MTTDFTQLVEEITKLQYKVSKINFPQTANYYEGYVRAMWALAIGLDYGMTKKQIKDNLSKMISDLEQELAELS